MSKKINLYNEEVYEINNFLDEKEKLNLLNFIQRYTESDWEKVKNENWKGKMLEADADIIKTMKSISLKIKNIFSNYDRINEVYAVQRFKPNMTMDRHKDADYSKNLKFGIVLYINNDYEGGEIFYPTLNLKIKPKSGALVIHPGDLDHEVLEVKNSIRYMITTFVYGANSTIELKEVV